MKRILIAAIAAASIAAPSVPQAAHFSLSAAITPQMGLLFAGAFDPGFSAAGLELSGSLERGPFRFEAGSEAGLSPIGWELLFPLRAGIRLGAGPLAFEALLEAAPGMALTRPVLFMAGFGAAGRAVWSIAPSFSLFASIGARWSICPAYGAFTGISYTSIDMPVSIGLRWTPR